MSDGKGINKKASKRGRQVEDKREIKKCTKMEQISLYLVICISNSMWTQVRADGQDVKLNMHDTG